MTTDPTTAPKGALLSYQQLASELDWTQDALHESQAQLRRVADALKHTLSLPHMPDTVRAQLQCCLDLVETP